MTSTLRTLWLSFLTSVLVTIPLAFVLTVYNLGFGPAFLHAYLVNSLIAVVVSTVASLGAAPLALRISGVLTAGADQRPQDPRP